MSKKKNKIGREKILTVFLIIVSVILLFSITSDVPKNIIKSLINGKIISGLIASPEDKKKNAMEETYNQIIQYEKNYDYAALYDYLTPTEKTLKTRGEYVQYRNNGKAYNIKVVVNSIIVHENIGVVDITGSSCGIVKNCANSERTSYRSKRQFLYINEKWYHDLDDNLYCGRFEKYSMPEEFNRAVSLIIQRMMQSGNNTVKSITNIHNCLDIQYAQSDDEMHGAEGVFMFSTNSTPDRLQIFVSPRYQAKDDLLTAVLLSHEFAHALVFAGEFTNQLPSNLRVSCYENEASAFLSQMQFLTTLNEEEKLSIISRSYTGYSQEAMSVINLIVALGNSPGDNPYQKALNYVKNIPFYQAQCANNQ